MEKNTILAVVLIAFVMIGTLMYQSFRYGSEPVQPQEAAPITSPVQPADSAREPLAQEAEPLQQPGDLSVGQAGDETTADNLEEALVISDPGRLAPVIIETDLVRVALSNVGGNIISYQLKEHFDKGLPVEMILSGHAEPEAFAIAFGNRDDVSQGRVSSLDSNFHVHRISQYSVEFYRDFMVNNSRVTLTKQYNFTPGEYMFEFIVKLDGDQSVRGFDFGGAAYTIVYGPQIGPTFERLDQRAELRQYITFNNNRVRQERINTQVREVPEWTAIVGKYFALIAIPNMNQFDVFFTDRSEDGIPAASRMFITRPGVSTSRIEDRYFFYLGPKKQEILDTYYNGRNNQEPPLFGYQLAEAAKTRTFFSIPPLENGLKIVLTFFYVIVPNYGVAIILVTILVKLLLFPLTRKSSQATIRMQALAPKIKEIQTKYKDNPQKMNAEMAAFYKKEGYNPLAGCLPMLIQMPIFFAMYNLFNNHFDLRGAMFIPGWIPDLSLPESIFNFAPLRLPVLGSDIRLLPFLYVGSQLLYGKVTQTPDQKGNTQMKMMLYVMPIVFFFILYDVPSGLLIYWIMSNVLTMVQQVLINKFILKKKAVTITEDPPPVIAPPKKKKKK